MARRRSALVSPHSRSVRADQALAQRRRHRPTWRPPEAEPLSDLFVAETVEGQEDDWRPVAGDAMVP